MNRLSWSNAQGYSVAGSSPHEQKMAGLLGHWRGILGTLLYTLLALSMLVMLNCSDMELPAVVRHEEQCTKVSLAAHSIMTVLL